MMRHITSFPKLWPAQCQSGIQTAIQIEMMQAIAFILLRLEFVILKQDDAFLAVI